MAVFNRHDQTLSAERHQRALKKLKINERENQEESGKKSVEIKIARNLIRINSEIAHNNVDNYSLMP
ncbi:hypothetical protein U1R68_08040 [Pectobacterium colocasium]|uniref:hypothetical protein n=1 Tax=Pectobacterium TaxID=122277 RepID=UPI001CD3F007|nr:MULTISPECIES: hypothetical protein [Pectobacterium]UYA61037.1 hypothetical protein NAL19_2944 [Pectobacterium sp. F1-1]